MCSLSANTLSTANCRTKENRLMNDRIEMIICMLENIEGATDEDIRMLGDVIDIITELGIEMIGHDIQDCPAR